MSDTEKAGGGDESDGGRVRCPSASARYHIHDRHSKSEMPEGLGRILDILAQSIDEPKPPKKP